MDLETFVLSEKNQIQKNKYGMYLFRVWYVESKREIRRKTIIRQEKRNKEDEDECEMKAMGQGMLGKRIVSTGLLQKCETGWEGRTREGAGMCTSVKMKPPNVYQ